MRKTGRKRVTTALLLRLHHLTLLEPHKYVGREGCVCGGEATPCKRFKVNSNWVSGRCPQFLGGNARKGTAVGTMFDYCNTTSITYSTERHRNNNGEQESSKPFVRVTFFVRLHQRGNVV